jgi:hypothetical protein
MGDGGRKILTGLRLHEKLRNEHNQTIDSGYQVQALCKDHIHSNSRSTVRSRLVGRLDCGFSTFRAVEQNPQGKIAEVLEPVFLPGGSEEKVALAKVHTLSLMNKVALAVRDYVDLIARVWSLGICIPGRVKLHD